MNHRFDNFNQLVDAALNTERKRLEIEDKKRKMVPATSGGNKRPRYQYQQQPQQQQRQIQSYQQRQQQSSSAAVGGIGPEASSASGTLSSTSSTSSKAGSAYSSCRTAGSSIPTGVLSLRRAGTLCQRLSPEGAVWTAGAPSSAQGAIPGQREPRDGRVGGRGS
jgi:hypothetical protein